MASSYRAHHTNHVLSPASAQSLVDTYSQIPVDTYPQTPVDYTSASSDSPDSLYSDTSPTFHDRAFEYDEQDERIEHHDEEEYASLMEQDGVWASSSWGRWQQDTAIRAADWSPSPKNGTSRKDSIISVSPGASLCSASRMSRRSSLGFQKFGSTSGRRESNVSLLGFDLAQRRQSSTRSINPSRRRSSAFSNATGSLIDPTDESRLRNITSMEVLGRRFSEVVEVTCPSDASDAGATGDVAFARARCSQWSPDSSSEDEDDDDSEILTAPYQPTPLLAHTVSGLISNFPLASVASEQEVGTPSDTWSAPSPAVPARVYGQSSNVAMSTPPPPALPSDILRARARPPMFRTSTEYQFPACSAGVPLGAAPPARPGPNRSVSTPFFSAAPRDREAEMILAKRAAGSFPFARPVPIGKSRLRESLRRESINSDGGEEARRSSLAPEASRESSAADQRVSLADRFALGVLEVRRVSLVRESGASSSVRRSSLSGTALAVGPVSRKTSVTSICMRRSSNASGRKGPASASRKSSVVSMTEYGYLAPQILIESPTPISEAPPEMPRTALPERPPLRRNAPLGLILPSYSFPATAPNTPMYTPLYTPRFNPLDSFFGRGSPALSSATPTTPRQPALPTQFSSADGGRTPMQSPVNAVMDRGRPVSTPEFRSNFAFFQGTPSPKSASRGLPIAPPPAPTPLIPQDSMLSPGLTQLFHRRPSPGPITEPIAAEEQRDFFSRAQRESLAEAQFQRRGAVNTITSSDKAILRAAAAHRPELIMEVNRVSPQRVHPRRQKTAPPELESPVRARPGMTNAIEGNPHLRPVPHQEKRFTQRTSVTFAGSATNSPPPSPSRSPITRQNSFSRFFLGKSKPASKPSSPLAIGHNSAIKPKFALRPISLDGALPNSSDGSGWGTDRTPLEVQDMFRRLGGGFGSPRWSGVQEEGKMPNDRGI